MKAIRRIVIKVGTSTLTKGSQGLSRGGMLGLVQQIAHLKTQGFELVLVSSGAVAAGKSVVNSPSSSKQMFASVGQVKLMEVWSDLFSLFDIQVGQVLLCRDDFSEDRKQYIQETLYSLLQHHVIPIINENDAVASTLGNNDHLAALVANIVAADLVILLTDQEGLYTSDPRIHPDAELIPVVTQIDERVAAMAKGSSTGLGTGGMATKIEAAEMAKRPTIIASSSRPNVLIDLIGGKQIGTLFLGEGQ